MFYRPLLVKMRSQDLRDDDLRRNRHSLLKDHNLFYNTQFHIDPDLTREQKENLEQMYKTARLLSKNGKKYYVIRKENPTMRTGLDPGRTRCTSNISGVILI